MYVCMYMLVSLEINFDSHGNNSTFAVEYTIVS